MNLEHLYKKIITIILLVAGLCSFASANFHYKSTLADIDDNDFYEIELNAKATSYLDKNFYDLKIIDSIDKPVPYILKTPKGLYNKLIIKSEKAQHNNISTFTLNLDTTYYINAVHINYGKNTFFHRKATIKYLDHSDSSVYSIHEMEINSTSNALIEFKKHKTSQIIIEIHNGDNPPLHELKFSLYSPKLILIAKLNASTKYTLLLGKEKAKKPNYDLVYFENLIPKEIRSLEIGEIQKVNTLSEENEAEKSDKKTIIWAVLAVTIIITSLITYKVLQEIK